MEVTKLHIDVLLGAAREVTTAKSNVMLKAPTIGGLVALLTLLAEAVS